MNTGARHEAEAGRTEGVLARAVICGLAVAVVMGASYPYVVLKLGFGPNVSVVAAFFGYLALGIAFKDYNRWENNIVQTAGTAAAQTAFMCVLLAAFDMLRRAGPVSFTIALTSDPVVSLADDRRAARRAARGAAASALRRRREADLSRRRRRRRDADRARRRRCEGARRGASALAIGAIASAAVMLMTEDAHVLGLFPSVTLLGHRRDHGDGRRRELEPAVPRLGDDRRHPDQRQHVHRGHARRWVIAPYALLRLRRAGAGLHAATTCSSG